MAKVTPPIPDHEIVQARRRRRWWVGWACALVGAVAFSGKAILAKLMYRHGVDATTVLFWRMAIAVPFFVAMAVWSGRGQARLDGPSLGRVVLLGFFGYYLASYLDFLGLTYISASLERLILYLNPTVVLILGVLVHRKRVSQGQLWAMGLSYLGVVLAFAHEIRFDDGGGGGGHRGGMHTAWGSLLVFGSAVSYAVYLSGSGELVRRLGSLRLVGWASSVACVLCIVQGLWVGGEAVVTATPTPVLWLSVLNGLLCTVVPMLLVMMGVERLGATTASQIGMVGPMSTVLMGVWVLGEPFTVWMGVGTALVLAGVALLARSR